MADTAKDVSDASHIRKNDPITKVVERLDTLDNKKIYTYWSDQGVVSFKKKILQESSLKEGDTIRLIIKDHEVIWFQKI